VCNDKIVIPNKDQFAMQDPAVLGAFVKLLLLSTKMTVSGAFVNGKVFSLMEIADGIGVEVKEIQALVETKLLSCVHGVYFVENAREYFVKRCYYREKVFASVMAKIRESITSSKDVLEIAEKLTECGNFQMARDVGIKEQIIEIYNALDAGRGKIQTYIGMFRTRNQIRTGSRMLLSRHLRLLQEIVSIYDSGTFIYDGWQYTTTKEKVFCAIDYMHQRQMIGLTNHNYLKVMLKNDNNVRTGSEKGRTEEGY
jgi:hypothetical protein